MGVAPNETFGYIWMLNGNDGPLEEDPQCLTQLYQSTVAPDKDLASGLVGTLLICKNEAIDQRGRLVRTDTQTLLNLCSTVLFYSCIYTTCQRSGHTFSLVSNCELTEHI